MSSFTMIEHRYLDELALAAAIARQEGVDRSQVNKLLECLESTDSFTLALFLARQAARGQWSRAKPSHSASRLFKVLMNLIATVNSEVQRKEILRKALGYFKWFYESWDLNRNALNDLQRFYGNRLPQVLRDPRQPAPEGFAEAYLRVLLRV